MTSVQQKASLADRIIARGEASKENLKVVGTAAAIVSGVVTVPAGTVVGAAGGAVKGFIKGDALINNDQTVKAARVLGAATTVVAGAAAIAGAAIPGLGPITLPAALLLGATGAGVAFAGSGLFNGASAAIKGGADGAVKGFHAGIGAAQVAGSGAQYVTDKSVQLVKDAAKQVVRIAGNVGEAAREGYEDLSVKEADAAQAVADALKAKANAVANGGPRYAADGSKLKDNPPDYK